MKKYALLDTDFISKAYVVSDDAGNHLIDSIMELPEYEFFCHAQILAELRRSDVDAPLWLEEKMEAHEIKCYTDHAVLKSLSSVYGPLAPASYTQMLKEACSVFSRSFFSEHYSLLEDIDYGTIEDEDYLKLLHQLDDGVGIKNNLGEIKSYVLLQVLAVTIGEEIYVFCSDDKNARNGALNFDNVRCISILSAYSHLKEEAGWTIDDAEQYIESLVAFYLKHEQTTFRVMEASEAGRLERVPLRQVLFEIFDDKFIELKNGMLRYKE